MIASQWLAEDSSGEFIITVKTKNYYAESVILVKQFTFKCGDSGPPILISNPDDVVFSQIGTRLHFDQLQWNTAGVE